ncbi:MAG: hypothetical protein JNK89_00855 [Saprospiraceae bacterium]|nr:hypothetical protein [Saprospiraceae bacterium]
MCERFPVLKNIAPVAFIVQNFGTILIPGIDRKPVPGPRRVAVPAAEFERQVFLCQSNEVRIGIVGQKYIEGLNRKSVRKLLQRIPVPGISRAVSIFQVMQKIPAFYLIIVIKNSAAHNVE